MGELVQRSGEFSGHDSIHFLRIRDAAQVAQHQAIGARLELRLDESRCVVSI
ncbi:MAG: hypothetical protein ACREVZ_03175 [Burkholderiales bacterium]